MTQQILTQAQLKEVLHYCPDTGIFTWKKRVGTSTAGAKAGYVEDNGHGNAYVRISVFGKRYTAHRLAFLYVNGRFPEFEVDHADGDGLNNKFSNLSDVTRAKNAKNMKLSESNKSGCTGVLWHKAANKWVAEIMANGKRVYLGLHETIFDAACARRSAEHRYGFHPNHGASERRMENRMTCQ